MLAAGKGWVLAMLAMLGPKPGLRVAARGSGPGAKRRRPCPPLRAVAAWKASGRRASRRNDAKRACRPGVEQRAWEGRSQAEAAPLPTPAAAWPVNALGAPYRGLSAFSASDYRPGGRQPSACRLRVRPGDGPALSRRSSLACRRAGDQVLPQHPAMRYVTHCNGLEAARPLGQAASRGAEARVGFAQLWGGMSQVYHAYTRLHRWCIRGALPGRGVLPARKRPPPGPPSARPGASRRRPGHVLLGSGL